MRIIKENKSKGIVKALTDVEDSINSYFNSQVGISVTGLEIL